MAKKIKSFTVDEDIYNSLVTKFKKSKVEVSVSLYLNNCLKDLLKYFEFIEKELRKRGYTVPMAFVIKEMVETPHIHIPGEGHIEPEDASMELEINLEGWQNDYEADQKGIPREMYPWLKDGTNYVLSPDKKYLIREGLGVKFIPIGGSLRELKEPNKE